MSRDPHSGRPTMFQRWREQGMPDWLEPNPKLNRWTPSLLLAAVSLLGIAHAFPHHLAKVFEGRPLRREDSRRLLDPVQQSLHSKIDIKMHESKGDEWLLEAFGNPDKGFVLISRSPYARSPSTPLKELYPERTFGPFAHKTVAELTVHERRRLLNEYRIPVLSPEEVKWSVAAAAAQLRDGSTNSRTVVLLGWTVAGVTAHMLQDTSRVLRHFTVSSIADMFFTLGCLHYTWVYRKQVYKADEEALDAVKDPNAALTALETQRQWNLQQRKDNGLRGLVMYTEKGNSRFEYPMYLTTRMNHLRDAIQARAGDATVVS